MAREGFQRVPGEWISGERERSACMLEKVCLSLYVGFFFMHVVGGYEGVCWKSLVVSEASGGEILLCMQPRFEGKDFLRLSTVLPLLFMCMHSSLDLLLCM